MTENKKHLSLEQILAAYKLQIGEVFFATANIELSFAKEIIS